MAFFTPGKSTPFKAFDMTKTGIVIQDDLSEDQWKEGLKYFKLAKTAIEVGLADYLSYGRAKYGVKVVDAALQQLEFDMPTVTRAIDISTIPIEMRHDNLTAEHYLILARANDLSKSGRNKWARTASEQNLTPSILKASIAAGEVVSASQASQQQHGIVNIHAIRQDFDIWMRRIKGVKGILKLGEEHRKEIMGEIAPIVDLYNKLSVATSSAPEKKKTKAAKKKH